MCPAAYPAHLADLGNPALALIGSRAGGQDVASAARAADPPTLALPVGMPDSWNRNRATQNVSSARLDDHTKHTAAMYISAATCALAPTGRSLQSVTRLLARLRADRRLFCLRRPCGRWGCLGADHPGVTRGGQIDPSGEPISEADAVGRDGRLLRPHRGPGSRSQLRGVAHGHGPFGAKRECPRGPRRLVSPVMRRIRQRPRWR